ncbi:MAG: hypothetical protein JJU18_00095 [Oceanicaulis sp.]|nr:hypothetical protein [Oceanicaulis sp.]
MKFLSDLFRPILTIIVTVLVGAFVASVFWPAADIWITNQIPAWDHLSPAIEQCRAWLGIHQPQDETPWWQFWR